MKSLVQETFYTLTGAVIIFITLEIAWPGIVLAYVNISVVLLFWLINGILLLLLKKTDNA